MGITNTKDVRFGNGRDVIGRRYQSKNRTTQIGGRMRVLFISSQRSDYELVTRSRLQSQFQFWVLGSGSGHREDKTLSLSHAHHRHAAPRTTHHHTAHSPAER